MAEEKNPIKHQIDFSKKYLVKKQKRGAGRAIFEEWKRRCKDG